VSVEGHRLVLSGGFRAQVATARQAAQHRRRFMILPRSFLRYKP